MQSFGLQSRRCDLQVAFIKYPLDMRNIISVVVTNKASLGSCQCLFEFNELMLFVVFLLMESNCMVDRSLSKFCMKLSHYGAILKIVIT